MSGRSQPTPVALYARVSSDVGLDTRMYLSQCAAQTIVLCYQHSDYLTPTGQHRSEDPSVKRALAVHDASVRDEEANEPIARLR